MTKPKLNVRQAKFVKAKAAGKSNTQAAMYATGTKSINSAKTLGHRLSTDVNVQEALHAEMARQGITLERIVAPINRALDAKKTVILGNGDDAFADVVDDHSVQLKASSMAAQFLGIGKSGEGTVNINFIGVVQEDRDQYDL